MNLNGVCLAAVTPFWKDTFGITVLKRSHWLHSQ